MNDATRIRTGVIGELGASSEEFQNLHEFIRKARSNLNQNAWDYIAGAAETETTMRRNRMALDEIAFRPRVLRNVAKVDASVEQFGRKMRAAGPDGAGRRAGDLRSGGGAAASVTRAAGQFGVAPYAEFGFPARPGKGRGSRARCVAHVSALRSRRRRLCRRLRQPRDQERLQRILPHRGHRALQPQGTRTSPSAMCAKAACAPPAVTSRRAWNGAP